MLVKRDDSAQFTRISRHHENEHGKNQGLNRLRKMAGADRKDVPQGLKPDVFSVIYGPTKVVP